MGHGPHSPKLVVICVDLLLFMLFYVLFVFVFFYVLFLCKCVLYYFHRVLTQLELTNISYRIILYHINLLGIWESMGFKGSRYLRRNKAHLLSQLRTLSSASFLLFTTSLYEVTKSRLLKDGFSNFGKLTTTGTSTMFYRCVVLMTNRNIQEVKKKKTE